MSICEKQGKVYWTDFVAARTGKPQGHPSGIDLLQEGEKQACAIDDRVILRLATDWTQSQSLFSNRSSQVCPKDLGLTMPQFRASVARLTEMLDKPVRVSFKEERRDVAKVTLDFRTYIINRYKIEALCKQAQDRHESKGGRSWGSNLPSNPPRILSPY